MFALLTGLLLPVPTALAGVGFGVVPDFPTTVTVGQTNLPATYTITNVSDGSQAVGNVTINQMTMVPSCSNFAPGCAGGTADPGTFDLSPTGVGAAGTACAGQTFNIVVINAATGEVEFQPVGGPVVLGPPSLANDLDRCQINFTFDVLKMPNHDSFAAPGVQTNQVGFALGTHQDGTVGTGSGSDITTVLQAAPTIVTTATPPPALGGTSTDSATLSGPAPPAVAPTGTITFNLFGPNNDTCTGTPHSTSTVPVDHFGPPPYTSAASAPIVTPGTYHWVASYSGDANYLAAGPTACLDPAETFTVGPANPTITTTATPPSGLGGTSSDAATLTAPAGVTVPPAPAPTGTITFNLFGPNNDTCTGTPHSTSTVPVNHFGPPPYTSGASAPIVAPGTYHWVATYSGDANYGAAGPTACLDPAETFVVNQTTPTIVTQASPSVPVGGQISDTATLAGGTNPTGTITFTLFGPNNATCTGAPIFTDTAAVSGNGNYTSDPFTVTAPGTYQWIAAYSGDANNAAVSTACNDPLEAVVVSQAGPAIVTQASGPVNVGGQITDTATLSGGVNPTGTITFTLFGPDNATCTGAPIFTDTAAVSGNGNYTSDPFTTAAPGTYRWIAAYSGDANNAAVSTACNDPNESVLVAQAGPLIVTQASGPVNVGGQITDTATLSGGVNPTGTITFTLFGPNNATCTGAPIFTDTATVAGNGNYTSDPFTVTAAGTYRWVAAYSGDANNAAVASPCNAPNENVVVGQAGPAIVTQVSTATANSNQPITDTATLSGGQNPTGTITFNLFGPDNATCTGTPIFTDTAVVAGNGNYTSDPFTPTAPGTYRWVVSYSGDANNAAVSSPCNAANEQTVVSGLPLIQVVKTVDPATMHVPGGDFTFTVVVTNTGPVPLVITSLMDDVYGNLGDPARPNNTCDEIIGDTLQPGQSTAPCTFVGAFTGDAGDSQTDVVTVIGVDAAGNTVTDDDDAVVTLFGGPPSIQVIKTVDPASRPVPGGDFTFSVVVTNTSDVPLTITSLTDDVYGNLGDPARPNNTCDDLIGDVLQPGASTAPCTFVGAFTGDAGDSQTDVVTVIGVDDSGTTVTDDDDAVVTLFGLPAIQVVKTVTPASREVPGGDFTFTVVVTNIGPVPLTITELDDNVYGNLGDPARPNNTCDELIGDVLQPGASTAPCTFVGAFTGDAGDSQTDVVTVVGVDNRGNEATDNDDAVVTLFASTAQPAIRVEKDASPASRPAPGGTFTFTVRVSNVGPVDLTIESLTDNIHGDLEDLPAPAGGRRCSTLIGMELEPGETSPACQFTGSFTGSAGDSQTDIVTVIGRDDEDRTVTDTDDAIVRITGADTQVVFLFFQNPPPAPPLIVNNNNSSSSSSSAAASASGPALAAPVVPAPAPAAPVPPPTVSPPRTPPRTLTRTGFDSLGLAGLAALLIVLGFMMLHRSAAVAPAAASPGKTRRPGNHARAGYGMNGRRRSRRRSRTSGRHRRRP